MVTDAGPLGAGDPASATGLSPETLADYLKTNRILSLPPCMLKIRAGARITRLMPRMLTELLTKQSDNQASYIALDGATPAKGAKALIRLQRYWPIPMQKLLKPQLRENCSNLPKLPGQAKILLLKKKPEELPRPPAMQCNCSFWKPAESPGPRKLLMPGLRTRIWKSWPIIRMTRPFWLLNPRFCLQRPTEQPLQAA